MAGYVIGSGKASIAVGPQLRQHVDRLLRSAAPKTVAAIERQVDDQTAGLRSTWPRKTGQSANGFEGNVRIASSAPLVVDGLITNRVPYLFYERENGKRGGKHYWTEFVVKPSREAARELARTLAAELGSAAEGR